MSFYSGTPGGPHSLLGISVLGDTGRATWTTTALGGGTDSLYAVYGGDANFIASTSPVSQSMTITEPARAW